MIERILEVSGMQNSKQPDRYLQTQRKEQHATIEYIYIHVHMHVLDYVCIYVSNIS